MREVHLRNVDLNPLHALYALLEERHVSHAAKRSLGFNDESFYNRGAEKGNYLSFSRPVFSKA